MTTKQSEYMRMLESGIGVSEIARLCGVSKGSVSTTLKKAREPKTRPRRASAVCRYSSNCFNCPLDDCVVNGADINVLEVAEL